jgi:Fe-S-cluster containining protein
MKSAWQEDGLCDCKKCKDCCWHNPGWFGSVEEVIGAAKLMNMSVKDFANEYLIKEWWAGEDENIIIPAPRRDFTRNQTGDIHLYDESKENGKGFVLATWGHNLMIGWACIFLGNNNHCLINSSKPKECKDTFGCKKTSFKRLQLLDYWKKHQDFIKYLDRW